MTPAGKAVLDALLADLEWSVRRAVKNRYAAMSRELEYLFALKSRSTDQDAEIVQREGWSFERVDVLCALNSFYQMVLGPQAAASRKWRSKEFAQADITHGSFRLDSERATTTRSMIFEFERRFSRLGFQRDVAIAPTAGALLFYLANRYRN